jgi:hypothetical protein
MQSGLNRIVKVLLHQLIPPLCLSALVVMVGCGGGGYDPPQSEYSVPGKIEGGQTGNDIDFEGQWKVVTLSIDSVPMDMEDSGLDVVLEIFADSVNDEKLAVRWHVKEDGRQFYYCGADDMDLEQDQQLEDNVVLSYDHVLVDPLSGQIIENDGVRHLSYTIVDYGGGLVELQDGYPPQGIVMLPELNYLDEQEKISLTIQKIDVDLSESSPTQDRARICRIKTGITHPSDTIDTQPPEITRFELLSQTPTTDPFIEFNLQAEDNDAVSAWLVNESETTPGVDDEAWGGTRPQNHTLLSGYGMKTVYAWTRDAAGNISEPASISIDYVRPSDPEDTQPPVITRFELSSPTPTTDPLIELDLQAEDNDAVSAWLVNESAIAPVVNDNAWSSTRPQTYTLSFGYGVKTVYAWTKDAAGNISEPASISVEYIQSCVDVTTTVLPSRFTALNINSSFPTGSADLLHYDDHEFLSLYISDDDDPMYLTVEFDLENVDIVDISDLSVSVSSITVQEGFGESVFRRSIYAYNYSSEEWDPVGGTVDIGRYEVRSNVNITGSVDNIDNYLGPAGDNLRFSLRVELVPIWNIDNDSRHDNDLVQLTITHPENSNCIDE